MTSVEFHILPDQARRQHDAIVCELVEREWQQGHRVHVHCLDADMVAALDELLWTFHDTSFVPHAPVGNADAPAAPVTLSAALEPPEAMDVLVNLHVDVPPFFSQFERVIETTGYDEHSRQLARERYRYYKDRGYPLKTHQR